MSICFARFGMRLCKAVMKFHGVGDPTKTPAEATALQMTRGLLATLICMAATCLKFRKLCRTGW